MNRELRPWQRQALNDFAISEDRDFLVSAPPGAGKTTFGCEAINYRIDVAGDDFVVVYAPSITVKRQWADKAAEYGIQLDPTFVIGNGVADGMDGVIVTYQAVAMTGAAAALRLLCEKHKTFSIRDEVHHAGRNLWGKALEVASSKDRHRLAVSGSPFRTDGARIPGVKYDETGKSVADFPYSIGSALRDGVIPLTTFLSFDGDMEWLSRNGRFLASFRDELPAEESSRRLRTSLDPNGQWLPGVLRRADDRLLSLRYGDPDAGEEPDVNAAGLVVCIDRAHAEAVQGILRGIAKEEPILVHHEDDEAHAKIKRFKDGGPRWIVSIGMISEGVDIPRLRVLTYATNKITFLLFLQIVGRLWRSPDDVYAFLPAEETLLSYAEKIDKEVAVALRDEDVEEESDGTGCGSRSSSLFQPIYSVERESDIIQGDDRLPITEVEDARKKNEEYGIRGDPVGLARLLRAERARSGADPTPSAATARRPMRAEYEDKEVLLRKYGPHWMATRGFAKKLGKIGGITQRDGGVPYAMVLGRLKSLYGGKPPRQLTTGAIVGQIELCQEWGASIVEAERRGEAADWALDWVRGVWDGSSIAHVS